MERAIARGANPNQQKTDGEDYVVRRYDGVIPTLMVIVAAVVARWQLLSRHSQRIGIVLPRM